MPVIYDKVGNVCTASVNVPGPAGPAGAAGEAGPAGVAGPAGPDGASGDGTGDALVANPLSQFAATTSLQLKNTISDETGSGALVFATSPTLTTPTIAGATFSGTVDFGAQAISNFKSIVNVQTGTTYTVLASDCGKTIKPTNGSAITITVTTAFPDEGSFNVLQGGAGQVTIAVTGLTIRNRQSFTKTAGQYAMLGLLRSGTDLILVGDGAV